MKNQRQLFEFVCELIDIQIKKYVHLQKIGIGPDAGMNAVLVVKQVEELFQLAKELLKSMNTSTETKSSDDKQFKNIFNQVQFYLEQEFLRGHAGWLIDENNIHTPEFDRLRLQKEQLASIAREASISMASPAMPVTDIQKQCEHDSHAIAFLILDLAIKLKADPEMKLDANIPSHAGIILRRHARPEGRYSQTNIWEPLQDLHKKCLSFLEKSKISKRKEILTKDSATLKAKEHQSMLNNLLAEFRDIQPDSRLFSSEHQWHNIAARRAKTSTTKSSTSSYSHLKMFGGLALAGVTIAVLLIQMSNSKDSDSLTSGFNFFMK